MEEYPLWNFLFLTETFVKKHNDKMFARGFSKICDKSGKIQNISALFCSSPSICRFTYIATLKKFHLPQWLSFSVFKKIYFLHNLIVLIVKVP